MTKKIELMRLDEPSPYTGVIYTKEAMQGAIEKQNFTIGGIGMEYVNQFRLENTSHQIKNLRIEGNFLVGDLEILNTQCGQILSALPENSYKFRLSCVSELSVNSETQEIKNIQFHAVPCNFSY